MRLKATIFIFLFVNIVFGQDEAITIDYSVDYVIPKRNNQSADTITVGFDKAGRYLWTDSEFLAKDLAKSVFKGNNRLLDAAKLNLLLDTENLSLQLFFNSGDNAMYMKLALSNFFPIPKEEKKEKNVDLISEPLNDSVSVIGREGQLYDVFPSNDIDDKITIALEENMKVNNNKLFKQFFRIALAAEGSGTEINDLELPDGLILGIFDDDQTLIEAISIKEKVKTITINHSFNISE